MIDNWLEQFKQRWLSKDIDGVMELFSDEVEYWETPFLKFANKQELRDEWEGVRSLEDQQLALDLYVHDAEHHKHVVRFTFSCTHDGEASRSAGVYLVTLNDAGVCTYFMRVSVPEGFDL